MSSTPADVPRQAEPYPRPESAYVETADAETQAYYRRLQDRARPPAGREAAERVQDAGSEWVEDKKRRRDRSDSIESATAFENQPTTSEPAAAKSRTRKREQSR